MKVMPINFLVWLELSIITNAMQIQSQLKKEHVFPKDVEQEITYIPINEQQELIKKFVHLTNSQAVIIPWKFWRNIRLSF